MDGVHVDAIWPFFACMTVVLAIAASPVGRIADAPTHAVRDRVDTLDGLRGFLALAVVFHHALINRRFLAEGVWMAPSSRFYAALGPIGVGLFFMITGYLFWSRMIAERGRPHWLRFYIARLFRIGPVYLLAFAVVAVVTFAATGWRDAVPHGQLAQEVGDWLTLGFIEMGGLNGFPAGVLLAGVTWTLHFEWLFYLSLPLIALATRGRTLHLPVAALGLVACFVVLTEPGFTPALVQDVGYMPLFLAGMTCASLHRLDLRPKLPGWLGGAIVVGALVAAGAETVVYSAGFSLLLGVAFLLVSSGCSLGGLLATRAARRLGNISYGLYLLQGLALAALSRPRPLRRMIMHSAAGYWCATLLAVLLLMTMAAAAHVLVERPGVALGSRLARLVGTGQIWMRQIWRRGIAARPSDPA